MFTPHTLKIIDGNLEIDGLTLKGVKNFSYTVSDSFPFGELNLTILVGSVEVLRNNLRDNLRCD